MTFESSGDSRALAAVAAKIVSQVVGEEVPAIEKVAAGVMTHKYQVTTASSSTFIVRFYPQPRSSVVGYEPDILRRCRAQGMRVPEVLADSRRGPPAPLAYLVYRMLPGTSLNAALENVSQPQLERLGDSIVTELKHLATLSTNGFGDLLNDQDASFRSWRDFLRDAFDRGLPVARGEVLLEVSLLDAIESIRDRLEGFHGPTRSALAWGDLSPDNVIVDESHRLVGLVDFEGVLAADMDLSLGFLSARYAHTRFCAAITRHWPPRRADQPFVALYAVVRALRLIRHFPEPLPTGVTRDPIAVTLPNLRSAVDEVVGWLDGSTAEAWQRS